jgi:ribosomal protein S18 acetylase RimI-like enzyme
MLVSQMETPVASLDIQEVSIRPMLQTDLSIVVELDALVFGSTRPVYFERRLVALENADAATRAIYLVAVYRDQVIGFIMGTLAYGEFGLTQVTAVLDSIAVHPSYQHQGIGQKLAEAFMKQSALQGASSVYTLVNWDNWTLLKVFHALGFELAATIPLERRID